LGGVRTDDPEIKALGDAGVMIRMEVAVGREFGEMYELNFVVIEHRHTVEESAHVRK
jgi:hypothetical protein